MGQTDRRWKLADELRVFVSQRKHSDRVSGGTERSCNEQHRQCVALYSPAQPTPRTLELNVRSGGERGSVEGAVGRGGRHHFFMHIQRVAVARRQKARQQADCQVARATVEASDACAVGDLSAVGPVPWDLPAAFWTPLDTCVAPALLTNVALAGVTARENDLHRHPKSAG